uniref:F-box domain-containing protein n=1 Tax=Manihot esculenta TaxID=3983 RepID=A0A2C9UP65_MANES
MEKSSSGPKATKEAGSKKIQKESSTMESLPREIALDILSRLPITSLIQVKWVCRSWRSLAQDPLLATMHFSRMNDYDPGLVLHCDLPLQNHLYYLHLSSPDIVITRLRVPMISEFAVVGSCNGLLCLWHSLFKDKCYIYNPFTRDFKELPVPEQFPTQTRVTLGFGLHPGTKEYKVVRIVYYRNEDEVSNFQVRRYSLPESEVQVLTLGNGMSTWRSKGRTSYQLLGSHQYQSQVLLNGRLHWLTCRHRHQSRRQLVSFDLADEKFQEVPTPNHGIFGRNEDEVSNFQVRRYSLPESEVQVLTLGNGMSTWRSKGRTSYQLLGSHPYQSQVLLNGRLHWLTCRHRHQSRRQLVSFDLADEQFQEVPTPNHGIFGRYFSHLAILRGCLAAITQGFRQLNIWVMKEYGVKESWVKEFSIGAHLPRHLDLNQAPFIYVPECPINWSQARALCFFKNGELLLEYKRRSLVSCDPTSGAFKEISFGGLPESFSTFVHIGSLNFIN